MGASLSSDVCGSCHGEPLRHARFQQWQLSPHANYELAIDEGESSNCSRCHSANGFVAWSKINFDKDTRVDVDWEANEIHPQTCAACHDPHKQGQTSGEPNTATVRVSGDTPLLMAGFQARDVGRGAVCMVCHNTRRGLINDQTVLMADDEAPHRGAQADMLMGQNAYFVQTGVRGKHSLITDTCANCHMEQTPPPDLLAYAGGGTNHTFTASKTICANCHDSITADEVQSSVKAEADILAAILEESIQTHIYAHLNAGTSVELWNRPRNGTPSLIVAMDASDTIVVDNYAEDGQDVDITVNGTKYEEVGVDNIEVGGDAFSESSPAAQVIVKSGWNLLQVRIDGSYGIHNPTWALQILAAAKSWLDNTDFTEVPVPPGDQDG
jgi:formate-dependent nitrite reductase cytochrome c552 subunit